MMPSVQAPHDLAQTRAQIKVQIKVRKLHPAAQLPRYAHSGPYGDLAADLYAAEPATLAAGATLAVPTGIALEFPPTHGALVEDHFREGIGAGLGFVGATVLLAAAALALTRKPSQVVLVATAALFIGLIAGYGFAISTGVPVLHPDVEAVDGLALFTKAVEGVGVVAAASLVRRPSFTFLTHPKGTTT